MDTNYFLLFKTAQSEFRAWQNLNPANQQKIIPIIELTRGRKIPGTGKELSEKELSENGLRLTSGIYGFSKNVKKVGELFTDCPKVILDVTREEQLSCAEIDEISKSDNKYKNWVNFVATCSQKLNGLIPTLLVNPTDGEGEDDYKVNLEGQLDSLMEKFDSVAYRASVLADPEFVYDLIILEEKINVHIANGKTFYIELDHEFIRPGTGIIHAARTHGIIEKIHEKIPGAIFITLATSFPKAIDELGDPKYDSFPLEEIFLHEQISNNLPTVNIEYGDYGSINPIRSDLVFASGWRPRIDYPTGQKKTFYYREKKTKGSDYARHYISVARDVKNNALYTADPLNKLVSPQSWGVARIEEAAAGRAPGKSPSFWISVRMEIHMRQQLLRLSS